MFEGSRWTSTSGWAPASETSRAEERRARPRRAGATPSNASRGDGVADRTEEAVALAVGDGAADDDPMRVEGVDEARRSAAAIARRARVMSAVQAGSPASSPAATSRAESGVHADDGRDARPGRRGPRRRRRRGVAGERGRPRRWPRGGRCRRSRSAARRASTGTWPSSPASPSGPWNSRPPLTIPPPIAGRDGQVDEVVAVAAGAERRLAERGDVRVAVQEGRAGRAPPRRRGASGMSWKSGPEVRRLDDGARARVDRARARRCRCRRAGPRRSPERPTARDAQRRDAGRDDRGRPVGARRQGRHCGQVASRPAGRRRPGCGCRRGRARGPVVGTGRTPGFVSGKPAF